MICKTLNLWKESEYHYPRAYGFMPTMHCYLHETTDTLPALIVCPGGAYRFVAPPEGVPVAGKFYAKGYQVFVCNYTTNFFGLAPVRDQAMTDVARAVRILRKHPERYNIDPNMITVMGFSAGGHTVASLAVHFARIKDPSASYNAISPRPDATILCYPVITSDPSFTHQESIDMKLGKDPSREDLLEAATELNVTSNTPPAFLWHTVTDTVVPVRNSIVYADALAHHNVPVSLHLFSHGDHGLSAADGNTPATDDNKFVNDQLLCLKKALDNGHLSRKELSDPENQIAEMNEKLKNSPDGGIVNEEAAQWVPLADQWMKQLYHIS